MKILSKGRFYGAKQSEYHVSGVSLSAYDYLTPKTDWHVHEHPYFMYVLTGKLLDKNQQRETACPAGSLLFHNWDEVHCNSKESRHARGFHIEFDRSWFEDRQLDISLWTGSELLEDPYLHHLIGKLYFEFSRRDDLSSLSIELLLLELCENIHTSQTKDSDALPPWIAPLKELLHHHHGPISLRFLSDQLNIHPVHLSRSIPKYFSITLSEYIRRVRIKSSLKYLLNSPYSLTEIAHLCGFSDQSHFTRTFKYYFNQTPKAYRNMVS
ncbi:MAG: helix-turn-helix transcriptional regulator [Bacteroidota bacterium]